MRTLMLVGILVLVIVISVMYSKRENFVNWAHDPENKYKEFEKTKKINSIVKPNPDENTVNNWQYDPQKTLVSYKYYETNKNLEQYDMPLGDNRATARLAPISSN